MLEKGSSFTLNAGDTATDTTVNGGLFTARGGTLAGTTTLNNGAILTLSGKTVNNDTLTIREGDALLQEALSPVTAAWKNQEVAHSLSATPHSPRKPSSRRYCRLSDDVQSSCLSYGELCHDGPLLPVAGLRPAASGMQRHYAHH